VYTAFADVSFFLVGPIAGAIIGRFGYRSVFLFALASVFTSLGIVVVLANRDRKSAAADQEPVVSGQGSEIRD
jgi:MFS family permease